MSRVLSNKTKLIEILISQFGVISVRALANKVRTSKSGRLGQLLLLLFISTIELD